MAAGAAGFWSYVRRDDEGEGGRILALAQDLRDQHRIRTAEELELFVDRDSIQWGEEWEQRIEDAIAGTTFFIPIITPSYFRSNACRQELLKFIREAERLGLQQLLMPIYWTAVPELETSDPQASSDEAVRAVAKYQRADFREIRFEERTSSKYRREVAELAGEIAKRAERAGEVEDVPVRQVVVPAPTEDSEDEQPGIIERLAVGEGAMEEVTRILGEIGPEIQQIGSRSEKAGDAIQEAMSRGKGIKAALPITARLAHELEEPSARIEALGIEYASNLADLDPAIHAWLDLLELQDETSTEQRESLKQYEELSLTTDEASRSLGGLVEGARQMSSLSRALRAPLGRMSKGLQGVLDGKAIIEEWGRRARELRERDAKPDSPEDEES